MTGATGFTGGHLAQYLAGRGDEVRALVRPRSRERFDRSPLPAKGVTAVDGDLMDAASVRRAVDGVEVVYHIAATYREAGQPDSAYRAINVDGTRNVLEAARAAGVRRVVHCSTGGVHGHIENPPATEDAPFNPGDVYQETKLAAEKLAREFGAFDRPRCGGGASDRHLWTRRHALSAHVPGTGARTLSDDRQRARRSIT